MTDESEPLSREARIARVVAAGLGVELDDQEAEALAAEVAPELGELLGRREQITFARFRDLDPQGRRAMARHLVDVEQNLADELHEVQRILHLVKHGYDRGGRSNIMNHGPVI